MKQHTCGDAGGRVLSTGQPCGQGTALGRRCIWHPDVAADQAQLVRSAVAASGGAMNRQVLPDTTPAPVLSDEKGCRRVLEETVQAVRCGRLDPHRGSVVIQGVRAAIELAALQVSAQVSRLERALARRSG